MSPSFFRVWKFDEQGRELYSEFARFYDACQAIASVRCQLGSLEGVEIWDGWCRVWPRLGTSCEPRKLQTGMATRRNTTEPASVLPSGPYPTPKPRAAWNGPRLFP